MKGLQCFCLLALLAVTCACGCEAQSPPAAPPTSVPRAVESAPEPKHVKRPDVDKLNALGFSELHVAARKGDVQQVHQLLTEGADVNVRQGKFLGTPLQYAAQLGHGEVVAILIEHSAMVDSRDATARTPLMWAAEAGHTDVVRKLLDAGADVNAKSNNDWTPLHFALSKNHTDLAQLLKERGADPRAKN